MKIKQVTHYRKKSDRLEILRQQKCLFRSKKEKIYIFRLKTDRLKLIKRTMKCACHFLKSILIYGVFIIMQRKEYYNIFVPSIMKHYRGNLD